MMATSKFTLVTTVAVLTVLAALFYFAPGLIEQRQNTVHPGTLNPVSQDTASLHETLFIADLHADSLLWNRNLLDHSEHGHIDVPRLIKANVALQAFTVVTRVPSGRNLTSTSSDRFDLISPLLIVQRWPLSSWLSLKERALYQSQTLRSTAERSNGRFVLIQTGDDLTAYVERRNQDKQVVAGFLGLEGAHALEGELQNVDELYAAGFRMLGLVHHFDNEVGGSSTGETKGGLTAFGKQAVQRAEELGMFIDLAHASPDLIDDVLKVATKPVVVSHTGVRGTCDNNRNLSDKHVKSIAQAGGVIGIGYWPVAICGNNAQAITRAIRYTTDLVGVDHVALGSDFDGAVTTPFDTTGITHLTDVLMKNGFSEPEIRKIMGENTLRVLKQVF